jgi:tRNA threonylcarbamoyladenosine biosynthesis protein TsaB
MLFLVIDTSGRQGFVALARADAASESEDNVPLIESVPLLGGTFSAELVPQIAGLLAKHGFGKSDIDAFIAVSGPGSFTGLRVGLAAIKALAEVLHKPIVPVSLLEVIAFGADVRGKIFSALDAGRGEVYVGQYEVDGNEGRRVAEQLLSRDEFLSEVGDGSVATPDPALANLANGAGARARVIEPPDAVMIARLGCRKLRAGEVVAAELLDANYIRRTDAEIFGKPGA